MPVSTNVLPASGPSPGGGPSSSKRRTAAQLVDQRPQLVELASGSARATIGPMPGVSAICSGVAASSASTVRKLLREVAAGDVADALDPDREQHDPERPLRGWPRSSAAGG